MVMWHGSTWNPANEPNGAAVFRTGEGETGSGAHFGTLKAAEERGADRKNWNLTPVYLNIKNPLRVADTGYWTPGDIVAEVRKTEKDFPWLDNWDEITSELKRRGYDGMVYENAVEDEGSDSYIALDANQVKSATDNTGAFDSANNDIRFKRSGGGVGHRLLFRREGVLRRARTRDVHGERPRHLHDRQGGSRRRAPLRTRFPPRETAHGRRHSRQGAHLHAG